MAETLVIDDDLIFCEIMQEQISRMGHDCDTASSLQQGITQARKNSYDVVFLDVTLPDGNGLKEIQSFKKLTSHPEIVIITGYGDPEGAEVAIKDGAWDYIQKPATVNTIKLTISRVLRYRVSKTHSETNNKLIRNSIVGNSPRIRECLELVSQAAAGNINVLITGETGTGKEVFAKTIHINSKRSDKSFVVADCTSIPETLAESLLFGHQKGSFTGATANNCGLFMQADQGTLFLDEIGDLSLAVQKSFLRVLQERKFRPLGSKEEKQSEFRLISATNRNLEKMITEGVFRKDLYYRLRTMNIHLPPMRERKEDILPLLDYYVPRVCEEMDISPKKVSGEFLDACLNYTWPGNVREFVNTVNIACSNALDDDTIFVYHLPMEIRVYLAKNNVRSGYEEVSHQPAMVRQENNCEPQIRARPDKYPTYKQSRREVVDRMESRYLRELIQYTSKDFQKACKVSGLSRARLYELLKKHSISIKHF